MRDEVCSTQSDQCTTLLHIPQHSTKTMPQLHPRLCKDAASLFQHGCKPNSTLKADARKHALLCSSNSLHKKPPARVWHAGPLSRLGLSTRSITHAQERQRTHTHGNTPNADSAAHGCDHDLGAITTFICSSHMWTGRDSKTHDSTAVGDSYEGAAKIRYKCRLCTTLLP